MVILNLAKSIRELGPAALLGLYTIFDIFEQNRLNFMHITVIFFFVIESLQSGSHKRNFLIPPADTV